MDTVKEPKTKKLLTKYFYKDNQLCFQILISDNNDNTIVAGEFTNYSEYKKLFASLQQQLESSLIINLNDYAASRSMSSAA